MNIKKILSATLLIPVVALAIISCSKTFDEKTPQQTDFQNSSFAQVFLATVGATRNYVYIDGKSVTGATLGAGSLFPSSAYAFVVEPGLRTFQIKDTLPTSTQVPLTFAENFQVARQYLIFVYDTITSPKQVTVPMNIVIPSDSMARLSFANFIYNSFDIPGVDVFSKRRNQNIFTNVTKNQVAEFVPVPSQSTTVKYIPNSIDTLIIRETGTANALVQINGFNPTQKRSYTLVYRGSHRGTKTASLFSNN